MPSETSDQRTNDEVRGKGRSQRPTPLNSGPMVQLGRASLFILFLDWRINSLDSTRASSVAEESQRPEPYKTV